MHAWGILEIFYDISVSKTFNFCCNKNGFIIVYLVF